MAREPRPKGAEDMRHEEGWLHIYTAPSTRIRRWCPYHQRLCYGERQAFYDTIRLFFDCGTFIDTGYGYWREPQTVTRTRWREAKRRHRAKGKGGE